MAPSGNEGTTALANQRRRCLFHSDWPVVGNFHWTYTSTIFPTAAGSEFSGLCFWVAVVMRTKNSRPANPSNPRELPRMPFVSCLSPVSSYPPGPLLSPRAARCLVPQSLVVRRLASVIPTHAAVPPSSCRPLSPRTATGPFVIALRPSSRPPSRRLPLAPTCELLPVLRC